MIFRDKVRAQRKKKQARNQVLTSATNLNDKGGNKKLFSLTKINHYPQMSLSNEAYNTNQQTEICLKKTNITFEILSHQMACYSSETVEAPQKITG